MKSRINLLKRERKYQQYELYFHYLRIGTFVYCGIFVVTVMGLLFYLYNVNNQYAALLRQKQESAQYLLQNKDTEAEFVYFGGKLLEISKLLKEDVNFQPYYNLLITSLDQASQEAHFNSVTIDKSKSVQFTVSVENYSSLLGFLKYVETDNFLRYFKDITLINFDLADNNKKYTLTFKGKFNEINETTY